MTAHIRRGTPLDLPGTARLLNALLAEAPGGAPDPALTAAMLGEWLASHAGPSAWHVAEEAGRIEGFQWIGPDISLPPEACEIGTFVRAGRGAERGAGAAQTGLGIGSRLFEATRKAGRRMGYHWIHAELRADNDGGLIYYQSRGFRRYRGPPGALQANAPRADRVLTRFDLT
jgi:GNAT superfamily N-acetyltransferase